MTQHYGCHDRAPFSDGYLSTARYPINGHAAPLVPVFIKFTGTKTCQYTASDLGKADPRCDSCKHKQAVAPVGIVQAATNSIAKNGNT